MKLLRVLALPLGLAVLGGAAQAASADESIALTGGTKLSADGGVAAWRSDAGRLVVRVAGGAPRVTRVTLPNADYDVGRRPGGGARLVYPAACSTARRTCEVRVVDLTATPGAARLLTRIPYRGGRPAVAIDRDTLAYSVRGLRRSPECSPADVVTCLDPFDRCDTLETRPVGARRARVLDRGTCPEVLSLDLQDRRLAVLALTQGRSDSFTEARVVRTTGGPSRRLQRERGSRSRYAGANDIGAVSIDGGSLYTAVLGDEQPNRFVRFALATVRRSDALAFGDLDGSLARDGGRMLYGLDRTSGSPYGFGCPAATSLIPCQIVAGDDPWRVARRLLPAGLEATTTAVKGRARVGAAVALRVRVSRARVSRTARSGSVPIAGATVELVAVRSVKDEARAFPTGRTAVTDADGRVTFPLDTSTPGEYSYTALLRGEATVPPAEEVGLEVRR
jgi:hypothetical protein